MIYERSTPLILKFKESISINNKNTITKIYVISQKRPALILLYEWDNYYECIFTTEQSVVLCNYVVPFVTYLYIEIKWDCNTHPKIRKHFFFPIYFVIAAFMVLINLHRCLFFLLFLVNVLILIYLNYFYNAIGHIFRTLGTAIYTN